MAVIKSGATTDQLTVDPTSKAARITLYDAAGREVSLQSKQTFAASSTFTPAATPTDLIIIEGSATKTLRIVSFFVYTSTTTAGGLSVQLFLIKRSTADTTGTFVAATAVPFDSNNAAATANRVGHFTANPGALGTAVGTVITRRVLADVVPQGVVKAIDGGIEMLPSVSLLNQPITLRGVAQNLALNFAGAALVAGQTHAYNIVWIEE